MKIVWFKTMEIMYTGYSNQLITWLMVVNKMLPYISFAYTLQPQKQKIHYIMIVNGNMEIVTIDLEKLS